MSEKVLQAQADMVFNFSQRAFDAMREQFAAKSRTDEELIQLCRRAWKIGILMMQTSPFRAEGASDAADSSGSGVDSVESQPEVAGS